MDKTEAQQIFDAVINLGYGEVMELSFPLDTAADSFRSALYRERTNWAKQSGNKDQIIIRRCYTGFPFKLEISRVPGIMGALVRKANGSTQPFVFTEKEEVQSFPSVEESKTEVERQKELMRADGLTELEINEYFKEEVE